MEFSKQEYWSKLPFPTPGDLPDPGNESVFPAVSCIGRWLLFFFFFVLFFTTNASLGNPFVEYLPGVNCRGLNKDE